MSINSNFQPIAVSTELVSEPQNLWRKKDRYRRTTSYWSYLLCYTLRQLYFLCIQWTNRSRDEGRDQGGEVWCALELDGIALEWWKQLLVLATFVNSCYWSSVFSDFLELEFIPVIITFRWWSFSVSFQSTSQSDHPAHTSWATRVRFLLEITLKAFLKSR